MEKPIASLLEELALNVPLPEPENYFEGLREPNILHVPDNILVFLHAYPANMPHSHSRHALVFPLDEMTYFIDRQRFPVKPGNVLLIPPYAQRFPAPTSSGFRRLFITFELQDKAILSETPQEYVLSAQAQVHLRDFLSAFAAGDSMEAALRLLLLLYRLHPVERQFAGKPVRALAARAVEYIEDNLSERLNVKELATQLDVSESHLRAVFRLEYKVSIGGFIAEKRLNAAKYFLLQSKDSLRKIAQQCGFANEYVFGAFFKRKMGISPMRYRRR